MRVLILILLVTVSCSKTKSITVTNKTGSSIFYQSGWNFKNDNGVMLFRSVQERDDVMRDFKIDFKETNNVEIKL